MGATPQEGAVPATRPRPSIQAYRDEFIKMVAEQTLANGLVFNKYGIDNYGHSKDIMAPPPPKPKGGFKSINKPNLEQSELVKCLNKLN